jgi:hypothetical protein
MDAPCISRDKGGDKSIPVGEATGKGVAAWPASPVWSFGRVGVARRPLRSAGNHIGDVLARSSVNLRIQGAPRESTRRGVQFLPGGLAVPDAEVRALWQRPCDPVVSRPIPL